jgi:hypothetical protein
MADATKEGTSMFGVIAQVKIDRNRGDEMRAMVDAEVVPRGAQMPGFAAGTWLLALEGDGGFAVLLFDSEQAARGFTDRVAAQGREEAALLPFARIAMAATRMPDGSWSSIATAPFAPRVIA